MQWSWKESKWSWKNHICPYFDCVACNFNKKRSNGLERKSRSSPFAMWMPYQSKMAVLCRGMTWLPMVGHTLAKTHVYKSKYTSLRTYLVDCDPFCVCPQSSAWSLTLLSLDLDQLYAQRSYLAAPTLLGNDATVNMGGSLAFPFLLLSDQSYSFCCGRSKFSAATMSHIQISNTLCGYCWCVVKPFIAVLVTTVVQVVMG